LKAVAKNRVFGEDWVAVELEFTGTNNGALQMSSSLPAIPPTSKKVVGKGTYFARIREGKIVEFHSYPDVAGMMMQLGFMPNMG
jgi:predicted ester cyclase